MSIGSYKLQSTDYFVRF